MPRNLTMSDPDNHRVTVEIEGSRRVVDTVVTLLRVVEACGRFGTSRFVELLVDGDGGCQIALRVDGLERPLDDAEVGFLLEGEGEAPATLRAQYVTTKEHPDGVMLRVEL